MGRPLKKNQRGDGRTIAIVLPPELALALEKRLIQERKKDVMMTQSTLVRRFLQEALQ